MPQGPGEHQVAGTEDTRIPSCDPVASDSDTGVARHG